MQPSRRISPFKKTARLEQPEVSQLVRERRHLTALIQEQCAALLQPQSIALTDLYD